MNLEALSADEVVAKAERVLEMARLARDAQRDGDAYLAQSSERRTSDAPPAAPEPAAPAAPAPELRCEFCHGLASKCAELRDDPRWLGEHQERPDVVAHRERQRQWRIAHGHETADGGGVLRPDPCRPGGTTEPDDETAVMLRMMKFGNPY
jgi:hypothetical protein